ncbi:unnamed protein product [Brassicogethes aeneus]|uniref:Uncharacterized protein n=1 Tax=Brassicogethes aeneus TaxID=1431903 RepID=A0A9P0ASJ9_BRAAE|nr:unnamed protein product [Brassicogethes aeneus]
MFLMIFRHCQLTTHPWHQHISSIYPPVLKPPPARPRPQTCNIPSPSANNVYAPPAQPTLATSSNTPQAQIPPKQDKIPPIILRNKTRWTMVSGAITAAGHSFSRATNIQDGVKNFPDTSDDYRAITKFLSENGEEYHTYQLPEESMVQAVIIDRH